MSTTSVNLPIRQLFPCIPYTCFEPPPSGDAPDHSTEPRLQANAGTAFDCAARLGGLRWGEYSSPGDRVVDSFFGLLDSYPSLLELFEAKIAVIEATSLTSDGCMPRITEEEEVQRASCSTTASITEDNFTPTTSGYWVKLRSVQGLRCRSRGDAILQIGRGIDDSSVVVSSIAVEFKRGPVHHTAAKGPPPSGPNSAIPLMPCVYVGSVIRETLFYQHVLPHLPEHLRKHIPQYHGTYRRTNGNGYAMVLENVGKTMNELDFYGSPGELWEIEAAFRELGIIHNDVRAGNVLVRPNNGPLCFVDWGRSYLKLRV
ncbi:BQ5605_C033g11238 [Microbotryum silenes-dioicae]|uniref:BQ5605_C033g11238 protein n=1 Tax=Microbotryum silenes-dioicae TaxID=796604 RepID=A0A2X0PBI6_9BASI|nr:BQ5605_C033g11238 [Microbotryum silenes-dioicae]